MSISEDLAASEPRVSPCSEAAVAWAPPQADPGPPLFLPFPLFSPPTTDPLLAPAWAPPCPQKLLFIAFQLPNNGRGLEMLPVH